MGAYTGLISVTFEHRHNCTQECFLVALAQLQAFKQVFWRNQLVHRATSVIEQQHQYGHFLILEHSLEFLVELGKV